MAWLPWTRAAINTMQTKARSRNKAIHETRALPSLAGVVLCRGKRRHEHRDEGGRQQTDGARPDHRGEPVGPAT
jgi:hypothetical protein